MKKQKPVDLVALKKQIIGALDSCISAHGPITHQWKESAAKRIVGAIQGIRGVGQPG